MRTPEPDFPDVPTRIARLERDPRGYPIPWFVDRPAGGSIDFRVMDPVRFQRAADRTVA